MLENLEELKSRRAKRVFAFSALTLLALEVVLLAIVHHKYSQIPEPFSSILKEVLINLISASIVGIFLAVVLVFLIPMEEKLKAVELLEPSQTKKAHDIALANTDFWLHHGHIGRWVRTTAMPALAKRSVEKGINVEVNLILLDPSNTKLCQLYCEYRNRIAFKENRISQIRDVQAELLATIFVAQLYTQSPNGLTVRIFLADQLRLVREDISSTVAFITQVDPRCSAIAYRNVNTDHQTAEFYNTAKTDFDVVCRCCSKTVPSFHVPDGPVSVAALRAYLAGIHLLVDKDTTFLEEIVARVESDYHPYH